MKQLAEYSTAVAVHCTACSLQPDIKRRITRSGWLFAHFFRLRRKQLVLAEGRRTHTPPLTAVVCCTPRVPIPHCVLPTPVFLLENDESAPGGTLS